MQIGSPGCWLLQWFDWAHPSVQIRYDSISAFKFPILYRDGSKLFIKYEVSLLWYASKPPSSAWRPSVQGTDLRHDAAPVAQRSGTRSNITQNRCNKFRTWIKHVAAKETQTSRHRAKRSKRKNHGTCSKAGRQGECWLIGWSASATFSKSKLKTSSMPSVHPSWDCNPQSEDMWRLITLDTSSCDIVIPFNQFVIEDFLYFCNLHFAHFCTILFAMDLRSPPHRHQWKCSSPHFAYLADTQNTQNTLVDPWFWTKFVKASTKTGHLLCIEAVNGIEAWPCTKGRDVFLMSFLSLSLWKRICWKFKIVTIWYFTWRSKFKKKQRFCVCYKEFGGVNAGRSSRLEIRFQRSNAGYKMNTCSMQIKRN